MPQSNPQSLGRTGKRGFEIITLGGISPGFSEELYRCRAGDGAQPGGGCSVWGGAQRGARLPACRRPHSRCARHQRLRHLLARDGGLGIAAVSRRQISPRGELELRVIRVVDAHHASSIPFGKLGCQNLGVMKIVDDAIIFRSACSVWFRGFQFIANRHRVSAFLQIRASFESRFSMNLSGITRH